LLIVPPVTFYLATAAVSHGLALRIAREPTEEERTASPPRTEGLCGNRCGTEPALDVPDARFRMKSPERIGDASSMWACWRKSFALGGTLRFLTPLGRTSCRGLEIHS
jgi:hypothetical protein